MVHQLVAVQSRTICRRARVYVTDPYALHQHSFNPRQSGVIDMIINFERFTQCAIIFLWLFNRPLPLRHIVKASFPTSFIVTAVPLSSNRNCRQSGNVPTAGAPDGVSRGSSGKAGRMNCSEDRVTPIGDAVNQTNGGKPGVDPAAFGCWSFGDSRSRGIGKIPTSCRLGYEKSGLLCYPPCRYRYVNGRPNIVLSSAKND
jgi:hypothetical protein